MSQYEVVAAAIDSALQAGHVVVVPKTALAFHDWVGTARLDRDPQGGTISYLIYGGLNGELTASGGRSVGGPGGSGGDGPHPGACKNPAGSITADPPGDVGANPDEHVYYWSRQMGCGGSCGVAVTLTGHDVRDVGTATNLPCQESTGKDDVRRVTIATAGRRTYSFGSLGNCPQCALKNVVLTLVDVQISDIPRVPIFGADPLGTNAKSVTVTVTPSPIPGGGAITLKLTQNRAAFDDGSVERQITGTTTVRIRGTQNSSTRDDCELGAWHGAVECAKKAFTVSTWPRKLHVEAVDSLGLAFGLYVPKIAWESESGPGEVRLYDLANVQIREHVHYGAIAAPFTEQLVDFDKEPVEGVGYVRDAHKYRASWVVYTGSRGEYYAYQTWQMHDRILDTDWEDQSNILGVYAIYRIVTPVSDTHYKFTTTLVNDRGFTVEPVSQMLQ